jgi:hypothetical protein
MEYERLLHPDDPGSMVHLPVLAGGLPVASVGGSVGAGAVGVLAVEAAEEVPLGVTGAEAGAGGEVPGLDLVEVDLGDGVDLEGTAEDLALEVVGDELLIRGVEAESGGEGGGLRPNRGQRRRRGGGRGGGEGHELAARVGRRLEEEGLDWGKFCLRKKREREEEMAWAIRKATGLFGTTQVKISEILLLLLLLLLIIIIIIIIINNNNNNNKISEILLLLLYRPVLG